ncbi:hypothetical protein [Haloarcula onubensis]|uniref:Secreted protein n=1 Tax=Haloarcula onubensis TaxID=2950539 RepID=A0ABU2FL24_9EURY|nr:hypothetical protein [Halomicroarcula sp. S3CR25-11]MDS0281012.1 hypothetical protein [Halomicroarcula sp. S3CR25-11]
MHLTKIAGVALALLLLTGTAAAMPGAVPAQADDNAEQTGADEPQSADDPSARGASGPATADADRGPPVDLPGQVPDFVGDLPDRIGQYLDGDIVGSLGEQLRELTPGDGDSDQSGADEAPDATATPTAQAAA